MSQWKLFQRRKEIICTSPAAGDPVPHSCPSRIHNKGIFFWELPRFTSMFQFFIAPSKCHNSFRVKTASDHYFVKKARQQ